jgi:hypothetical protein
LPLVNVGISDHELNPSSLCNIKFLDKCYLCLIDCAYVIKNGKTVLFSSTSPKGCENYINIHVGGNSLLDKDNNSFDIFCKSEFLKINSDYKLADTEWTQNGKVLIKDFENFLSDPKNYEIIGSDFERIH